MIVASIRNGFQQHSLKGLGCGDCGGSCGGCTKTGPPIGLPANHIHEVMEGLGWTGTCLNPTILTNGAVRDSGDMAAYLASCYPSITGPEILTNANAKVDANGIVVTPVVSSPVSMVAPTATPVSQVVQQSGGATGVISTTTSSAVVDNPLMDFIDSTIFGIPLWLIGVGGAVAIFMGSE